MYIPKPNPNTVCLLSMAPCGRTGVAVVPLVGDIEVDGRYELQSPTLLWVWGVHWCEGNMPFWLFSCFCFWHRRAIVTRAGSQRIDGRSQQNWDDLLGKESRRAHTPASLRPRTLVVVFFLLRILMLKGKRKWGGAGSWNVYIMSVHQSRERAEQWHNRNLNSEKERDRMMITSLYSFNL